LIKRELFTVKEKEATTNRVMKALQASPEQMEIRVHDGRNIFAQGLGGGGRGIGTVIGGCDGACN